MLFFYYNYIYILLALFLLFLQFLLYFFFFVLFCLGFCWLIWIFLCFFLFFYQFLNFLSYFLNNCSRFFLLFLSSHISFFVVFLQPPLLFLFFFTFLLFPPWFSEVWANTIIELCWCWMILEIHSHCKSQILSEMCARRKDQGYQKYWKKWILNIFRNSFRVNRKQYIP